ncbi:MAG: hypothetical protein MJ180_00035 [Candidatus Gastranaerophilales bacterium]|nr:hypothetical protein [Candidatus Gastranaerophilales bacterium]
MSKIGVAWNKYKDDGTSYISIKLDDELLPFTITKEHIITLFENKTTEYTTDKSPAYTLTISLPKEK